MVRNVFHRLQQLETRAKQVAATHPPQHTICFIEPVNKESRARLQRRTASRCGRSSTRHWTGRNSSRSF